MMTIKHKNGTIKIKRSEELQSQLPPDNSIALFNIKVTAKKSEANIHGVIRRQLALELFAALYFYGAVFMFDCHHERDIHASLTRDEEKAVLEIRAPRLQL